MARHLAESYGDKAFKVAKLASPSGRRWPVVGTRLHPEFPYLDVEVVWAVREYAQTAVDVIGRRLRLAFLNNQAAEESLPRVIELMAHELKWDKKRQQVRLVDALSSKTNYYCTNLVQLFNFLFLCVRNEVLYIYTIGGAPGSAQVPAGGDGHGFARRGPGQRTHQPKR